jgi:hypothetical protein
MARLTLDEMLNDLRAEANISLLPGHNTASRDAHIVLLRRVQRELWLQHTWPDQIVYRDVPIAAHQAYYEYPSDLDFEAIQIAWVNDTAEWVPLGYGITPEDRDIYADDFYEGTPEKYQHYTDNEDQFELWPIPDATSKVRFKGMRRVAKLVEAKDKSTLDGTLIVLFAASELLAQAKNELAGLKQQKATAYFHRLRGMLSSQKTAPFVIGGGGQPATGRPGIDYIPSANYGTGS